MRRSDHAPLVDRVVRRAALLGGTHGNELTGVTSVRRRSGDKGRALPSDSALPQPYLPRSFQLHSLISNPGAVAANRRYLDYDLNRCFSRRLLSQTDRAGYEHQRAQVLNRQLGPKDSPDPLCQFVIDLHTTTAGLGPTVIIREDDPLARIVAAAVCHALPEVRVLSYIAEGDNPGVGAADLPPGDPERAGAAGVGAEEGAPDAGAAGPSAAGPSAGGGPASANLPGDYPYLAEVTPSGIEIEVGPVPQGVVRADVLIWTERIINAVLATLDAWNADSELSLPAELEVYRFVGDLDYPRDASGGLAGMVHPELQDRDFAPLHPGDPVFLRFDGSVVSYDGAEGVVPVFVNEAAYYEKRAALTLAEPRRLSVLGS